MEEEGTAGDTTEAGEAGAAYPEVVTYPEKEVEEVRKVEVAMEVGAVEEWEVTTEEREVSPPVEAEVNEEVEAVL